jgi:sugar lactone lactonase YvrE
MNHLLKPLLSLLCLCSLVLSVAHAGQTANYNIIARLNEGPGNITVTVDGRIILSLHQFYEPKYSVVELKKDGSLVPFPNGELNNRSDQTRSYLDSVLGIRSDANGVVWMLDNGMRSGTVPKLVGWDTKANKPHKIIKFSPPIAPKDAFVNDFAVDLSRNAIYIADPAGGANAALIVVNLVTNQARRVLEGHRSVVPEPVDLMIDNRPLQIKGKEGKLMQPHIGINPITMDLNGEWVYFGAMHGKSMYRIKAADLVDEKLSTEDLANRVERYSDKPISDGITIDKDNNIYLGDLAANAIGIITPDRKYERLAQSSDLSWVDALSFGPEGRLYAVVNRLHLTAALNGGESLSKPPYFVLEVKPRAPGLPGR